MDSVVTMHDLSSYWYSRWLFERGLALMYLVAFLVTVNQFLPLAGARGLTPAAPFLEQVPFGYTPSVFHWMSSDRAFVACAWIGVALSLVALSGIASRVGAVFIRSFPCSRTKSISTP